MMIIKNTLIMALQVDRLHLNNNLRLHRILHRIVRMHHHLILDSCQHGSEKRWRHFLPYYSWIFPCQYFILFPNHLSRFVLGAISAVVQLLAPYNSLAQILYRQTLFLSVILYGGTYFANAGLSFKALKESMQDIFGLYFFINLIFLTSAPRYACK